MPVLYKVGKKDTRPWGTWEVIAVGAEYIVKRICVLPGKLLSLQLHRHRAEHWVVVEGAGTITLGDNTFSAPQDTPIYIPVGVKHRMANLTDKPMTFIEIQTGATLDESDIVRFEDSYGRV